MKEGGIRSIGRILLLLFISAGPLVVGWLISIYTATQMPTFFGLALGIVFIIHAVRVESQRKESEKIASNFAALTSRENESNEGQYRYATILSSQYAEILEASGPIEIAVKTSRLLEKILAEQFGATGKGLHEKIDCVQERLHPKLIKQLRHVATIRNKLVHEVDFKMGENDGLVWRARCIATIEQFGKIDEPATVQVDAVNI